jgi:hypothetical protein
LCLQEQNDKLEEGKETAIEPDGIGNNRKQIYRNASSEDTPKSSESLYIKI